MVLLEFFINIIWPHDGPGVDSASNKNGYQEYFLGGKGNRCIGLATLPPSCAVLKSRSLNLLAPLGPVQACTGIVIPNPLWYTTLVPIKQCHPGLNRSWAIHFLQNYLQS
jgi:hypothetical protein